MSENTNSGVGNIGWFDITTANAENLKDFYSKVVGWEAETFSMGDYDDFVMVLPGTDTPVAGICHSRGSNKDLPKGWIIYITVKDIDYSIANVISLGGKQITPIKKQGEIGRYCVVEDPAGGVLALYQAENGNK